MLRRVLLVCGVLSSLLYVGIDVLVAIRFAGYHSFVSQTISELAARGAPTKPLVDPLLVLYDLLAIGFGVGVWISDVASGNRPLRITAGLLIGRSLIGPASWLFPMNVRGSGDMGGDVPHLVVMGMIVLFVIAAVSFGAFALGRRFRLYSFATLLAFLGFGTLVGMQAQGVATGQVTPWIGLTERANVGVFLLWVAVLAIALLRVQQGGASDNGSPNRWVGAPHHAGPR